MRFTARIKALLLIRDHEWALVNRMFAFEFFQGVSIALFYTSAVVLFLAKIADPITELPKVFILSAFLLWFFGWLYSLLEHLLNVKQITLAVLAFNAASIVAFRIFNFLSEPWWFYYLMLAWYNVIYLLNNLEFWGLASRLFDVRQSKRLFGIVSAGDIPAKLIGYLSALIIIPLVGQMNLLWIAGGASLLSLFFFHRLISLQAFQTELNHPRQHQHHSRHNPGVRDFYRLFVGNTLIRQVATISFFTLCCYITISYVFYGYVKVQFHHDASLSSFITLFLTASSAVTLIIKLFFTNRITNHFGIRKSLFITPTALGIICLLSFFPAVFGSAQATFYLFGVMAIVMDVLRPAIQLPVMLATLQPLPVHQRLQGHTVIKGIMAPFAYFFVGVLLELLNRGLLHFDLRILSAFILAAICLWVIWIISADKNYLHALGAAIHNRLLNERDLEISDGKSLTLLMKRFEGSMDGEALFVFKLLHDQGSDVRREAIGMAAAHRDPLVRAEAARQAPALSHNEAAAILHHLIKTDQEGAVVAEALKQLTKVEDVIDFSAFLNHKHPEVAGAALTGIFLSGVSTIQREAEEKLKTFAGSPDRQERKVAAQVIGESGNHSFHEILIRLIQDPDVQVSSEALQAVRQVSDPLLVARLTAMLKPGNATLVLEALRNCGADAVEAIKRLIGMETHIALRQKFVQLLGRMKSKEAVAALNDLLDGSQQHRNYLLQALMHAGYHAEGAEKLKHERLLKKVTESARVLVFYQDHFVGLKNTLVADAFHQELLALRTVMLHLFAIVYDRGAIQKAMTGLLLNSRESLPNALELIDHVVAKEFSEPFICIFENSTITQKCNDLARKEGRPYMGGKFVAVDILTDQSHKFSDWTKACLIYSKMKRKEVLPADLVQSLEKAQLPLLREIVLLYRNENAIT